MRSDGHRLMSFDVRFMCEDYSLLRGRVLLFVGNVDWFFVSHRLPLAHAARAAGMHVYVAAEDTGEGTRLAKEGFVFVPMPFTRSRSSLFREARAVKALHQLLCSVQPHLIHSVGHKAILYSALARLGNTRDCAVIHAISGLGSIISSGQRSLSRVVIELLYSSMADDARVWTVFQNEADFALYAKRRWVDVERTVLIPGSGVDCDHFTPASDRPASVNVILPSRLLGDKGVREFVAAARSLRTRFPSVRFCLVGDLDMKNPSAISQEELHGWLREGVVEWWGHQPHMVEVYQQATVVALPSYREGLSKALLEAASCGCAIVTTDVPGCREVVDGGACGIVVAPHDADQLAEGIAKFLESADLRREMGAAARRRAIRLYNIDRVKTDTLNLYRRAISRI